MESEVREPAAAVVYRTAQSLLQRLPVSTTFAKWAIVGGIGYLVNQFALFAVYDSPLFAFLPARGTDFDFINLRLFSHPDVRLLIASVVAVQVAIVSNFYWHERWTLRQRERRSPGLIRFLRFNRMSFGSLLIVLVTVNTLTPAFGLSPYIANTIGVGLGASWSWIGDNQVIWRHILVTTLLVILGVAVFSSLDSGFLIGNSDFNWHFGATNIMIATGVIQSPHFLFQLLVIIVDAWIPNVDTSDAAFIVILTSRVALGVIIYALIQRAFGINLLVAAVVALALTIIAPITIFTWPDNLYFGYIGMNVYHSPTIQVLQPLALLLFFYAARTFTRQPSDNSILTIFIAGMLTILATLVKPSYTIVLLPGLAFLAYSRHLQKRQVDWRLMILGILLPAIVVLGWQSYGYDRSPAFLVSSQPLVTGYSEPILISPFLVYSHYSSTSLLLPLFVLSILFPLCVYALYFKKASIDISLSLAWPIFLVAAFYAYFLAEPGARTFDGNLLWGAQVALLILFVFSTALLVQQEVRTKRFFICAAVFALHLISGVVWYDSQIFNPMGTAWG